MNTSKHPKRIAFLLLLVTVLSLLTGCLRTEVGITVNEDDSGQVELSFGISQDYYRMLLEEYGTELYEGRATTEVKDGDTTYVCVNEVRSFETLEELEEILLDLEYTDEDTSSLFSSEDSGGISGQDGEETAEEADAHIFKSADITKDDRFFTRSYTLHLVTNGVSSGEQEDALFSVSSGSVFRVLVNVTLPGTVRAEGAVIQGNTVSFTLTDISEENVLHIESSETDAVRIVAVIVLIVCTVILIVLLFGGGRKKNAAREMAENGGFDE